MFVAVAGLEPVKPELSRATLQSIRQHGIPLKGLSHVAYQTAT